MVVRLGVSSVPFFCYPINAGVLSPVVYPGRSQMLFVSMMIVMMIVRKEQFQ